MNSNSHRSDSAIEEQASLWAARLDGNSLNPSANAELRHWLDEDPRHRPALSAFCQFSADLEHVLPILISSGVITRPEVPAGSSSRERRTGQFPWRLAGVAAAAAAIAIAAVFTWPSRFNAPIESVSTAIAQRQSITLPDGTQVELNAHTHLVIENTPQARHVRLASGQAFFKVTKDPSRPFIVETPAGSVRVTGTAFDVRATPDMPMEVTVQEGSVQVRLGTDSRQTNPAPYSLAPGDQLSAPPSLAPVVRQLSPQAINDNLAWRDGLIVCFETPLHEALSRLAYYHGRGISADPEAADLLISGRFRLDDLAGFFADVESILPVRVTDDLSGTTRVVLRR